MSTDGSPPGRFSARIAAILVLALLAAALAAANLFQGPRLREAQVNPELLVSRGSQRIVLHLSQPVLPVEASRVTVTPQTPHEVSSDGSTITVRFETMLRYANEYRVSVRVTSAVLGTSSIVETVFTTPDIDTYTLVHTDGGDRIMRHRLSDPSESVQLFEAPRIYDYAALDGGVAAIVGADPRAAGGLVRLVIQQPDEPFATPLAEMERFTELRSDPAAGLLGVIASGVDELGERVDRALLLYDGTAKRFTAVRDQAGQTIPTQSWRFVPGTASVVLQSVDGELLMFESWPEERLVRLGISGEPVGFLAGTSVLAVISEDGEHLFDFSAAGIGGIDSTVPELEPLEVPQLARRDAAASLALGAPAAASSRVGRVCVSPNWQYAAIETVSAEGEPSDDSGAPMFTHTTTRFVLLADGRETRSAIGGLSDWCD